MRCDVSIVLGVRDMNNILPRWCMYLALLMGVDSLRILQFVPGMTRSHMMFNYRLATYLQSRGHQVTLWTSVISFQDTKGILGMKAPAGMQEFRYIADVSDDLKKLAEKTVNSMVFEDLKMADQFKVQALFRELFGISCEQQIYDEDFIAPLRNMSFDVALSHNYDLCPFAIQHELGISKVVWHSAGTYILEYAAATLGIPLIPSSIPHSMSKFSDYMSFVERLRNSVYVTFVLTFISLPMNLYHDQDMLFRSAPNQDNPSLWDMTSNVPSIGVNGEPSLDFPRPFHSGVLFLGDLSSQDNKKSQLEQKWEEIVTKSIKGTIIFSLGSIANTSVMPEQIKMSFLNAFAHYPNYSIIWKFDGVPPFTESNHSHIHFSNWLPQAQLIKDNRTRLFLGHGGYNSLVEATKAAVPMVLLPLFADQTCNAIRAVRHGLAEVLDKLDIDEDKIVLAMNKVLNDPKYQQNANKFARILDDKIGDPLETFNRHLNSVVNSKWNDGLKSARHMHFFKYHCLDVIAVFFVSILVILRLLYKSMKLIPTFA